MKIKYYAPFFLVFFLLLPVLLVAQEREKTTIASLVCTTANQEILDLYTTGFAALEKTEYYNTAGRIFYQITQMDNKLCDAYYYTGLSLTKQDKDAAAYTYLYYADSLSTEPILHFKIALAESALRNGNVGLARKKYEEVKQYFPKHPEGYYGLALTATSIGDIVEGLVNTDRALAKYKTAGGLTKDKEQEIFFIKAILLRMNAQYEKAIEFFDQSKDKFGVTTDYLANYALTTYELYLITKNEKWKKDSQEALKQLQDLTELKEGFLEHFVYE